MEGEREREGGGGSEIMNVRINVRGREMSEALRDPPVHECSR